jgi:hypothetical protein
MGSLHLQIEAGTKEKHTTLGIVENLQNKN